MVPGEASGRCTYIHRLDSADEGFCSTLSIPNHPPAIDIKVDPRNVRGISNGGLSNACSLCEAKHGLKSRGRDPINIHNVARSRWTDLWIHVTVNIVH